MLGRSFKFLLPLALAACSTTSTPGIKVEYIEKPVIQVQPCVKASDVPERPSRLASPPDNLERALSLALAKVSEWTRYGKKSDVILKGCSSLK